MVGGGHAEAWVETRHCLCELAVFFPCVGFRDSAQAVRPCGLCRQVLFLSNTPLCFLLTKIISQEMSPLCLLWSSALLLTSAASLLCLCCPLSWLWHADSGKRARFSLWLWDVYFTLGFLTTWDQCSGSCTDFGGKIFAILMLCSFSASPMFLILLDLSLRSLMFCSMPFLYLDCMFQPRQLLLTFPLSAGFHSPDLFRSLLKAITWCFSFFPGLSVSVDSNNPLCLSEPLMN